MRSDTQRRPSYFTDIHSTGKTLCGLFAGVQVAIIINELIVTEKIFDIKASVSQCWGLWLFYTQTFVLWGQTFKEDLPAALTFINMEGPSVGFSQDYKFSQPAMNYIITEKEKNCYPILRLRVMIILYKTLILWSHMFTRFVHKRIQ